MASIQTQAKQGISTEKKLEENNPTMPKTNPDRDDRSVKVERSPNGEISLKIPKGSKVGFKYERRVNAQVTGSGTIDFRDNSIIDNVTGIKISRNKDSITITASKEVLKLSSITYTTDGKLFETDLMSVKPVAMTVVAQELTPSNNPQQNKSQEAVVPRAAIRKKLFSGSRVIRNIFNTEGTNKIESRSLADLKTQAKELGLPESVAKNAKESGITDLSLVKIEGDQYVHCEKDVCTTLGLVEATAAKVIAGKPTVAEQKPTEKIAKGFDLTKLEAGSTINYSYKDANGMKTSGSIGIPQANSATSSFTMPGVGKFTKNPDNTFSLQKESSFSGTISQGEKVKQLTPSPERKSNIQYLDGNTALKYIEANRDKEVVAIVSAHFYCPPCENLKQNLPQIAAQSPNVTYLMVNPNNRGAFSSVTSYPSTFNFNENRSSTDINSSKQSWDQTKARFGLKN